MVVHRGMRSYDHLATRKIEPCSIHPRLIERLLDACKGDLHRACAISESSDDQIGVFQHVLAFECRDVSQSDGLVRMAHANRATNRDLVRGRGGACGACQHGSEDLQ